ncbi:MAG: hypothetical protein ACTSUE_21155 [Promethearchaeota archaeon]
MSPEDIDFTRWGKKEPKPEVKKEAAVEKVKKVRNVKSASPSRSTEKKRATGSSRKSTTQWWNLKPKHPIPIEKVPIDALRGLYYFVIGKTDKKLSKSGLKRNLQEILSTKEKFEKLLQGIIDVIKS